MSKAIPSAPDGYRWGIARASRYRGRPPQHLIGPDVQMVCTGGLGLFAQGHVSKHCTACVAWARRWWAED